MSSRITMSRPPKDWYCLKCQRLFLYYPTGGCSCGGTSFTQIVPDTARFVEIPDSRKRIGNPKRIAEIVDDLQKLIGNHPDDLKIEVNEVYISDNPNDLHIQDLKALVNFLKEPEDPIKEMIRILTEIRDLLKKW